MQQMEWREAVAEARAAGEARELRRLHASLADSRRDMLHQLEARPGPRVELRSRLLAGEEAAFLDKLEEEIDEALQ
jgi:molecular chaperone HscB